MSGIRVLRPADDAPPPERAPRAPPILLRTLYAAALTAMHFFEPAAEAGLAAPPACLLLLALAHAVAVHAPSVWAAQVHPGEAVLLLEHMVYYFLLQAGALSLAEAYGLAPARTLWTAAAYFAAYYAWHVHELVRLRGDRCTLSPGALALSMAVLVGVTAPAVLGAAAPRHYPHDPSCAAAPPSAWPPPMRFGAPEAVAGSHLAAAVAADVVRELFALLSRSGALARRL